MEWTDATTPRDIREFNEPIISFLTDRDGVVKAWITKPPPGEWYWTKFGAEPPRGPFKSLATAKFAAELMYDIQTKEEK